MSSVVPESGAERLEEGKEGRSRSSVPARLSENSHHSPPKLKLRHSTLQTGAEQGEEWPALPSLPLSSASLLLLAQPLGDPAACLGIHLSPPKPPAAKPAFRPPLLPVPAAAARCLTPSCPEHPKSSPPARRLWLNHQHTELYKVGSCMDVVLTVLMVCPALVGHPTSGLRKRL